MVDPVKKETDVFLQGMGSFSVLSWRAMQKSLVRTPVKKKDRDKSQKVLPHPIYICDDDLDLDTYF